MHTIEHAIRNDKTPRKNRSFGPPIFVIGGALGGGKTTLLKQLLSDEVGRGRRPAVLMNEVAGTNVNSLLLHDWRGLDPGFDLHVVRSSCTCCDPRPAISDLLRRILRSARGAVFIEATGLAPPGQLAETVEAVLAADSASAVAHLASVIAVLDSRALAGSRVLARAHREDIAAADTVVLNKTDLVGDHDVDQLVARVRAANADARVFFARYGSVSPAQLLQVRPQRSRAARTPPSASWSTTQGLVSATAQLLGPVVVPRLQRLLARNRRDLVRVKGFMHTQGAPGLHEVQWVPDTMEVRPRCASLGVRPELVIVGQPQLDWERLATELDRCIEVEPTDTLTEVAV